jgi:uncharacterized protein with GYD domain
MYRTLRKVIDEKMPTFVILGNFTQKRMETIKDLPESVKKGKEVFKSYGVKIKELIFTMGRYDLVAICEAPDAESISKTLLNWGSKGILRTETLTGFPAEKMVELVKGL